MRCLTLVAIALVLLAGNRLNAADVRTFEARGTLVRNDAAVREVTIAHEAIPDYMPAMTMDFRVPDFAAVADLHSGDILSFRLCVTEADSWIERIQKVGSAKSPVAEFPSPPVRELAVGEVLPDLNLVSASGKPIRLRDFRGKPLAISFIYLSCPLPTYCPLVNRNYEATQDLLTRLGEKDKAHLLSVSLDPKTDTPEHLKAFAANLDADESFWTFAVAQENDVRPLANAIGLEFQRKDGQIIHNLRTVVIDGAGRVRHIFRGNEWTPQALVAELRAARLDALASVATR